MSKLKASEVAGRAAEQAVQVAGGWGYGCDHPRGEVVPRREALHDLRGHERIQRLVIGRTLGDAAAVAPLHHRARPPKAPGWARRSGRRDPPALARRRSGRCRTGRRSRRRRCSSPRCGILGPPRRPARLGLLLLPLGRARLRARPLGWAPGTSFGSPTVSPPAGGRAIASGVRCGVGAGAAAGPRPRRRAPRRGAGSWGGAAAARRLGGDLRGRAARHRRARDRLRRCGVPVSSVKSRFVVTTDPSGLSRGTSVTLSIASWKLSSRKSWRTYPRATAQVCRERGPSRRPSGSRSA